MKHLSIIITLLFPISALAELYHCKNAAGETEFRDKSCQNTQRTIKKYQYTRAPKQSSCAINCDAGYQICTAFQDGGAYNSDGGIILCQHEKQACHVGCVDPQKASKLAKKTTRMRNSYNKSKSKQSRHHTKQVHYQKASAQDCTPITQKMARKLALKDAGYFNYNHLSRHQKERVDERAQNHLQKTCRSSGS